MATPKNFISAAIPRFAKAVSTAVRTPAASTQVASPSAQQANLLANLSPLNYVRLTSEDVKQMGLKKGGKVKMKSASSRADGCAQRGKTRGKII